MPHGTVNALAESSEGYIWLATFNGLARFDGFRFRSYDLSHGLLSNRITSLLADSRGDLWIGYEVEGVSRLENGVFTHFQTADGVPDGTVWAILEDGDGTIWLGSEAGLASLSPGDSRFRRRSDSGTVIRALLLDHSGDLWAAGFDALFRRQAGETELGRIGRPPADLFSMLEDEHGRVWFSSRIGLHRLTGTGEQQSWQTVVEAPCPEGRNASFATAVLDHDGDLWFRPCMNTQLSSDSELFRIRAEALATSRPTVERFHIPRVPVTVLLPSTEGGLWLGTFGQGVGALMHRRIRRWRLGEALQMQEIRSMVGDGRGGLWIGANCGAPLIHFRDGAFSARPRDPAGGMLDCIGGLNRGEDGVLWVGARGDLVRLGADGAVERRTLIDVQAAVGIYAVLEGQNGASGRSHARPGPRSN